MELISLRRNGRFVNSYRINWSPVHVGRHDGFVTDIIIRNDNVNTDPLAVSFARFKVVHIGKLPVPEYWWILLHAFTNRPAMYRKAVREGCKALQPV